MPRTPHAPPELLRGPFRLNDALAAGLTRHQLASQCWVRLFRSVYVHRSVELSDAARFDAVRLIAPADAAATGLTAAWLYGLWTPPPGYSVPLDFAVPLGRSAYAAADARSRRLVLDEGDIDELNGVPITNLERTCFGLMARSSPREAVVWADVFLNSGFVLPGGLMRYADERPYWPHVRKVRAALARARVGARSPMETRLRLVVVDGGLREPDWLNKAIFDKDGNFLGEPDIGYDRPHFGLEYDGAYHETADQRRSDNRRENRLLLGNVPLLRYTKHDVYREPDRIVREVGAMLGRGAA